MIYTQICFLKKLYHYLIIVLYKQSKIENHFFLLEIQIKEDFVLNLLISLIIFLKKF